MRALLSENTPGHAEQEASRSGHLSRQKSPMLRMLREALGISLKSSANRPCRCLPPRYFPFQSLPVLRGFLDLPLKHSSGRPAAKKIFFAALFRRLSHPKELKQKREGNPERIFLPSKRIQALNDERLLNRSLSKDNLGIGLLSHVKVRSIMGDEALNFRVRNGIGCTRFSMDTKEIFQNI